MFSTLGTATGAGPWEMTSATVLPGSTVVPGTGFWLMTWPMETVSLYACVTAPTARPAPVMAACAAAWVMFTTSGTDTGWEPRETTSATALPGGTEVPVAGFWLMTWFIGMVLLKVWVTIPTVSPAPVMTVCAAAWASPVTLGTFTGALPAETTKLTAVPGSTVEFAAGSWLMTVPAGTVSLCSSVTPPTTSRAPLMRDSAVARAMPTTLGTVAGCGPSDTTRFTGVSGSMLSPAGGSWLMMTPAGTVSLYASVRDPSTSSASAMADSTAVLAWPVKSGRVMSLGGHPVSGMHERSSKRTHDHLHRTVANTGISSQQKDDPKTAGHDENRLETHLPKYKIRPLLAGNQV